jgi:hypothetical protein
MGTPTQFDQEVFRILLCRNDATELLFEISSNGLRIPALPIPAHARVAQEITAAIKSTWNLETYCLFTLPPDDPSHVPIRYEVVEGCRLKATPPRGMQWLPVVSLSAGAFEDPRDFAAIQDSLSTLDRYRRNELPGVFGEPGWLRMITEWVATQAAVSGLCLSGEFRQCNASPSFSLVRFETDGPALWFKAVGEPNLHEHSITLGLASLFPEFLPRILGSRPEWNAWLAMESDGIELGENATTDAWGTAVENLALLQIASFGRRFELINAGCKDLRPYRLVEFVDPFLDAMAELMERQTKLAPAALSRQELVSLGHDIRSALKELEGSAIPNTLGHLDMNPGNLLVCGARCVFLDWAEAYVGPPFFAFQYLLENSRRLHGEDPNGEQSLLSSYARHWTRFASFKEIAEVFRVAPLLAAFTYAASSSDWRNHDSIRPEHAAYLRSLTRRMKREADALEQRGLICVP